MQCGSVFGKNHIDYKCHENLINETNTVKWFWKLEYKNVHVLIFLFLCFYYFYINNELKSQILKVQVCQSYA